MAFTGNCDPMGSARRRIFAGSVTAFASLCALAGCQLAPGATSDERTAPISSRAASPRPSAIVKEPAPAAPARTPSNEAPAPHCTEQRAQEFLRAAHWGTHLATKPNARAEWEGISARAVRYRTEQYGYFPSFGRYEWNPRKAAQQQRATRFFGVPVVLHERVIPALSCVEEALRRDCGAYPYQPQTLAGFRKHNTYLDGGVSNHVYGIALDIDPTRNPCCHCVEPWKSSPRCEGEKTKWQRMDMPECWVTTFERYGFYWLGHDVLEDTMHFEFLGDPAGIMTTEPTSE